jgi:hypothetical protein
VVERVTREDEREARVVERQAGHVAHAPVDVRQPARSLSPARLLDHPGRQVDPGHPPGEPGEVTGDEAGPTGDVQHVILGRQPDGLADEPHGVLVGVRRVASEGLGLRGELLDDQPVLGLGIHHFPLRGKGDAGRGSTD